MEMRELVEDLNYDFNYNMFILKNALRSVESVADRRLALQWLHKLSACNKTLEDLKLRNEFMFHMVNGLRSGELCTPFDAPPPDVALTCIAHMLVSLPSRAQSWIRMGRRRVRTRTPGRACAAAPAGRRPRRAAGAAGAAAGAAAAARGRAWSRRSRWCRRCRPTAAPSSPTSPCRAAAPSATLPCSASAPADLLSPCLPVSHRPFCVLV